MLSLLAAALLVLAVLNIAGLLLWYAASFPASQLLGPALVRGPVDRRRVALTFDDGPLPPYTGQVLDALAAHGVHATFFVCGANAEQHPETLRRIAREGHALGNHTWSHPYLYFLSRQQAAVQRIAACAPLLFRPPYGGRWFGLWRVLDGHGLRLVNWSQWPEHAGSIAQAALAAMRPGDIILLHDGLQPAGGYLQRVLRRRAPAIAPGAEVRVRRMVEELPTLLAAVRAQGYEFVTVPELLDNAREAG
jgi:peptidoglycan/xylan/chitin deacetylase (PgdA/CDA1 family)